MNIIISLITMSYHRFRSPGGPKCGGIIRVLSDLQVCSSTISIITTYQWIRSIGCQNSWTGRDCSHRDLVGVCFRGEIEMYTYRVRLYGMFDCRAGKLGPWTQQKGFLHCLIAEIAHRFHQRNEFPGGYEYWCLPRIECKGTWGLALTRHSTTNIPCRRTAFP